MKCTLSPNNDYKDKLIDLVDKPIEELKQHIKNEINKFVASEIEFGMEICIVHRSTGERVHVYVKDEADGQKLSDWLHRDEEELYMLRLAISKTEPTDLWISVKDSLPKIPEGKFAVNVIANIFDPGDNSNEVHELVYEKDRGFLEWIHGPTVCEFVPVFDTVTHWMPMPGPPEEDKK